MLLEHSPLKKIAYGQYAKLEAENKALKAEIEQLKAAIDQLKGTAAPEVASKSKKADKKAGE